MIIRKRTKLDMDSKLLWFIIFLIIGLVIIWGIGAYIAWDMLWFIHTVVGRILGVIFLISSLVAAGKTSQEM
jgi:hypothetical protein